MDYTLISSILNYLPIYKRYHFSNEICNRTISKYLKESVHKSNVYIFYPTIDDPEKLISLPSGAKSSISLRNQELSEMICKVITNFIFFYKENENHLNVIILNPYVKSIITFEEPIKEIHFYSVEFNKFYAILNNKFLYVVDKLQIVEKASLNKEFFYRPVLINDVLYSDVSGKNLVVQKLSNANNFQTSKEITFEFDSKLRYIILGANLILVDLSTSPNYKEYLKDYDVISNKIKYKKDCKNCLFSLTEDDTETGLNLKLIRIITEDEIVYRFDLDTSSFYSKPIKGNYLTCWVKGVNIGVVHFNCLKNCLSVFPVDKNRLAVQFPLSLDLIDFYTGKVVQVIDIDSKFTMIINPVLSENNLNLNLSNCSLTNSNSNLESQQQDQHQLPQQQQEQYLQHMKKLNGQQLLIGNLFSVGEYYCMTIHVSNKGIIEWKHYILNQAFDIIYEMENNSFVVVSDRD